MDHLDWTTTAGDIAHGRHHQIVMGAVVKFDGFVNEFVNSPIHRSACEPVTLLFHCRNWLQSYWHTGMWGKLKVMYRMYWNDPVVQNCEESANSHLQREAIKL